jgi:hypothetical protein
MVTGHKEGPPPLSNERIFVPGLCTKFIRTPHLRKAWREALLSSDSWGEVQGLLTGVEVATIEDPAVGDQNGGLSITESMTPNQPKSASHRSKPAPPPLSPVWEVLEADADSLKLASTQSHDAVAAKGPMLAALQSICDLGSSVDLDLEGGVADIWDTSHWDVWRSRVTSLCGRVRREGARRRRSSRNTGVRFYIQQRHIGP